MSVLENAPIGVLLMAYGSPDSVDELGEYLLDIRGGRPTSEELVDEIKERYRQIGGRSPLLDLTRQQAAALETELNRQFGGSDLEFRTYLGMRHWTPRIRQAVEEMVADGIKTVVPLVMAPHRSRMSTGAYLARLDEACRDLGVQFDLRIPPDWHDHPGLIEALAVHARQAIKAITADDGRFVELADQHPYVIFSAHSLPARILEAGDPYDSQLRTTAGLLADALNLPADRWEFCYQSAGQSGDQWLGPAIETVIQRLIEAGEKRLVVSVIGFVCDHVEVLYDIDIVCRQLAERQGAALKRSSSLNDSPDFIATLADLVSQAAGLKTGTTQQQQQNSLAAANAGEAGKAIRSA
jgi:protoporphyrin/coproporphyrin ferrochelatase